MRFCLVSEASVPEETVRLLREACGRRSIPFEVVTARTFDFDPSTRLQAGDLLYRAASSLAASRAEQFLFASGVATFYAAEDGAFIHVNTPPLWAEAAGIPMPKTVYLASASPELLRRQVEQVGGFPVVVKVLGRSSGIGVMLAESFSSLRSLVEYALAQGHNPLLCQFVRDAVHWRVIVLGQESIATYRNKRVADDFRSRGSTDLADFKATPPARVIDTALRATAAFRLQFAGVDVLEDTAGQAWFLEANFPCYYPHAQLYGGVDIAGRMVDFLAAKAGHSLPEAVPVGPEICRVANVPDLFTIDGFADEQECEYVLSRAARIESEKTPGIATSRDGTGFSFEMPAVGDEVLVRVMKRIYRALGVESDLADSLRFRRYAEGESHPAHLDEYEIAGRSLVATAVLYLNDTGNGGETLFPNALPAPVRILPRRGRLAFWFNYRPGGSVEPAARHSSAAVERGVKATVAHFIYKKIGECDALRASSPALRTAILA